jgi:F420H(2)-dependent quinone reductase
MPLTGTYEPGSSAWARKQAERYESTGGAEAATLRGRPIIVLTSVGAKTGKLRKVSGDEKAIWWARAVETWPDYATYQTKTDRQIPVFVLEPLEP